MASLRLPACFVLPPTDVMEAFFRFTLIGASLAQRTWACDDVWVQSVIQDALQILLTWHI